MLRYANHLGILLNADSDPIGMNSAFLTKSQVIPISLIYKPLFKKGTRVKQSHKRCCARFDTKGNC